MATAAVLQATGCTILTPITAVVRSNPACGWKENSSKSSCRQRRRSRADEKRKKHERAKTVETNAMALGKVRILKRGESLNPNLIEKKKDPVVCLVERPVRPPMDVVKRISVCEKEVLLEHRFAGCAYLSSSSPPPTSVPVPKFELPRKSDASIATDTRRIVE